MDANGLLHVDAQYVRTGKTESLTITRDGLNLKTEEITRLIDQGEFVRERAKLMLRYQESQKLESSIKTNRN